MARLSSNRRAFTLAELLITLAVLVILAAIAVPIVSGQVERAKIAADESSLWNLNLATRLYFAQTPDVGDINDGSALTAALISGGYIDSMPLSRQSDASFSWNDRDNIWELIGGGTVQVGGGSPTGSELSGGEITFGGGGHNGFIMSYTGTATSIVIPLSINNVTVKQIYQDVFKNKGLTSVEFASGFSVTRIHARAFMDNNLTEITLPQSLSRLDYGAFLGNNIHKITIGSGVRLENSVFGSGNAFREAYNAGGAGTYILTDGIWTKS